MQVNRALLITCARTAAGSVTKSLTANSLRIPNVSRSYKSTRHLARTCPKSAGFAADLQKEEEHIMSNRSSSSSSSISKLAQGLRPKSEPATD